MKKIAKSVLIDKNCWSLLDTRIAEA
jgi:hypothetical protein